MRNEVSALCDGALDAARSAAALTALRDDAVLRAAWNDYRLIGDALRRTPGLSVDLTARVMAELRDVPTILVPPRRPVASRVLRHGAALAASLAGVGVVGWLVLQSPWQEQSAVPVMQPAASAASVASNRSVAMVNTGRMQEYLLAHQAYSPSNRFGGTAYIRTVSAAR